MSSKAADVAARPDPHSTMNEDDLIEAVVAMGFSHIRARKGLLNGGGTVTGAVEWIFAHQEDVDMDDPIPVGPGATTQPGDTKKRAVPEIPASRHDMGITTDIDGSTETETKMARKPSAAAESKPSTTAGSHPPKRAAVPEVLPPTSPNPVYQNAPRLTEGSIGTSDAVSADVHRPADRSSRLPSGGRAARADAGLPRTPAGREARASRVGAYDVPGGSPSAGGSAPDAEPDVPSWQGDPIVSARLVEDEETVQDGHGNGGQAYVDATPLVVARREGAIFVNTRDRRVQMGLAFLCLAAVGGIVAGVVVATRPDEPGPAPSPVDESSLWIDSASPTGSASPTAHPSSHPSTSPLYQPSFGPTVFLSVPPSAFPSSLPTKYPTGSPSARPTHAPSVLPSASPTYMSWEQIGQDLFGKSDFDRFGWSVSLSDNGSRLAVSAPSSEGFGDGWVGLYEYLGGSWRAFGELPWYYYLVDDDGIEVDVVTTLVSLSDDGEHLAVGYSPRTNTTAGFVQVYGYDGGNWTAFGEEIWGSTSEQRFGGLHQWADDDDVNQYGYDIAGQPVSSLSISADGRTLAIGSPKDLSGSPAKVRLYRFNGSTLQWDQLGLHLVGIDPEGRFGNAVSLSGSGDRVAIGDPQHDNEEYTLDDDWERSDVGAVRIYEFNSIDNSWQQLGQRLVGLPLANFYEVVWGEFGASVSLSGDGSTIAAAAPYRNSDDACPGMVKVHKYSNANEEWVEYGDFIWKNGLSCEDARALEDDDWAMDDSGYAVSLSYDGTRLAVGMGSADLGENEDFGTVLIYDFDGISWVQVGRVITGDKQKDRTGWSVSLSSNGRRLAVGAPLNRENGNDSGQVRVFELMGV